MLLPIVIGSSLLVEGVDLVVEGPVLPPVAGLSGLEPVQSPIAVPLEADALLVGARDIVDHDRGKD